MCSEIELRPKERSNCEQVNWSFINHYFKYLSYFEVSLLAQDEVFSTAGLCTLHLLTWMWTLVQFFLPNSFCSTSPAVPVLEHFCSSCIYDSQGSSNSLFMVGEGMNALYWLAFPELHSVKLLLPMACTPQFSGSRSRLYPGICTVQPCLRQNSHTGLHSLWLSGCR